MERVFNFKQIPLKKLLANLFHLGGGFRFFRRFYTEEGNTCEFLFGVKDEVEVEVL